MLFWHPLLQSPNIILAKTITLCSKAQLLVWQNYSNTKSQSTTLGNILSKAQTLVWQNFILCSKPKVNALATIYFKSPWFKSITKLSYQWNLIPCQKHMVLVHGNYLSKPMVNLMAIISISLTYRLSFEAYIQEVKNFARELS